MSVVNAPTPGPWNWSWGVDDQGNTNCGVYWMKYEGHAYSVCRAPRFQSKAQWEADARLIAAAPELLEALAEMLERYVSLVNSGDAGKWNPEDEPQVQQARAAIRKATGAAE